MIIYVYSFWKRTVFCRVRFQLARFKMRFMVLGAVYGLYHFYYDFLCGLQFQTKNLIFDLEFEIIFRVNFSVLINVSMINIAL